MDDATLRQVIRGLCEGSILLALLFVASGSVVAQTDAADPIVLIEAAGVAAYAVYLLLRLPILRRATQDDNPDGWSRAYALTVLSIALFAISLMLPATSSVRPLLSAVSAALALGFFGWFAWLYARVTQLD